ncbi:MAG: histone deacetylase [Syntrophobacteraceae bacterium]
MRRTGFLYDERYLLHITGPAHPEAPDRLLAAYKGVEEAGLLPHLVQLRASPAKLKWIETIHSSRYIWKLEEACMLELGEFEHPDNQICKDSYDVAVLAVGGILDTAKAVMEGKIDNAFCAVRPPGHHAEPSKPLGFCYFNNIAIVARYLQMEWNVERIGIIDFDVHHGNGTQHIFEADPTVFFYSIHEHPTFCFPGTGREFENGYDAGSGYTLNSPILPGAGDKEYMDCIEKVMVPAFDKFKPQFLLVSAGFDAHRDDDMSGMTLSTEGFSWIMRKIMEIADKHAGGRVISVLEGGYSLARLPELIANHLKILLDVEGCHTA